MNLKITGTWTKPKKKQALEGPGGVKEAGKPWRASMSVRTAPTERLACPYRKREGEAGHAMIFVAAMSLGGDIARAAQVFTRGHGAGGATVPEG
jgi:hypothetical protein